MSSIVRAAVTQVAWTGDKETMIKRHEELAREAADDRVQIIGFQELFYGPYFGIVPDQKYYSYVESVPGPTTERFQALAKELGMVIVLPVYEVEHEGEYYNTAAVIDADGSLLGKYRKHHIPNLPQFWEKFYFKPGNLGYPVFETSVGRVGLLICYDRHFPEPARALGLKGAELVFNPSATVESVSRYLWELEQPAHAVANGYWIAAINRVGVEAPLSSARFYGSSYFCDPRGRIVCRASDSEDEVLVCDVDLEMNREVRNIC